MLIGIKKTPQPGKPAAIEVFYAGHEAAALFAKHAELVKANTDGKSQFVMLRNPSSIPLASVETPTEEHPDTIAARKRQAELAEKARATAHQTTLKVDVITEAFLKGQSKNELLELAEKLKVTISENANKPQVIAAILAAQPQSQPQP